MLAPKALFRPVAPSEPVATLVMIENSMHMVNGWPDLRDHHLPTLLGTMRVANPVVPIQVLWLISSPVGDDDDPRGVNGFPNISFDRKENNRISVALIGRGVSLLTNTFKDQAAGRHLIIVAASSPRAASASEWQLLAARMQTEKIFLHVVMNPAQEMERINNLFYDSLGRQNHQELVAWFPADTTMYRFRLAGTAPTSTSTEGTFDLTRATPVSLPGTPATEPPSFFRNYTFPMDTVNTLQVPHLEHSTPPPPPAAEFVRPSLVTRLQKIHGLTRKKKYGAQPAIEPFLREDRVVSSTPPSISSLTTPPTSPIAESRLPAKSKADRAKRMSSKGPLATSPTTSARPERRGSWFRRKRNTPAPDLEASPTAGSSHRPSSPIPTTLDLDAPSHIIGMSSPVLLPWEGSWQNEATHHPNTMLPMYSSGPGPSSPSYIASSSATASYRSSASPPMPSSSFTGSPIISDLDKPFNISPEYEAAATARFHAIFNTNNPSRTAVPDFTSMSMNSSYQSDPRQAQYNTYPNVGLPPLPPQSNSSHFGMALQYEYSLDPQPTSTPYEAYDYDAVGAATSSLEGWDGQFPM